ncbi:restriction endonuclease [bacterium]|nr:restriction endonuclease [bacterium]
MKARKRKKKKRLRRWSSESLAKLNDEELIEVFITAVSDRSDLETRVLEIKNRIKDGAPPHAIELLLREAERRKIPLSTIAKQFADEAFSGNSFVSDICAPTSWKRYEIHAAGAILTMLRGEKIQLDTCEFDARVTGKITGEERQVDLLIGSNKPRNVVACEFKDYQNHSITVGTVEAFATKLKDIGANKGMMITPKGYQSGAVATAKHYGIVLFRLREVGTEELRKSHPEKASLVNDNNTYWIFETEDGTSSWTLSGRLTENAHD